jgi:folate-dependent phosphoribosylglycinamide formyltransferase PurN
MNEKRILLLAGEWDTTPVVYQFLAKHFIVEKVIIEAPVSRKKFLKNRIKKLGYLSVAGQTLFQLLVAKPMRKVSEKRVQEILREHGLSRATIPDEKIKRVKSVNEEECLQALREAAPDLVIVHGTRIISKKILQETKSTFINIHAGITPRYRGSHGAYWALANNDTENCGVTVHLVDPGIDTGGIAAQGRIEITAKDNFTTYPYLQLAKGLELLKPVIENYFAQNLQTQKNNLNSALWHHPTIWYYLQKRLLKRVK